MANISFIEDDILALPNGQFLLSFVRAIWEANKLKENQ
jgi:hypothetical protein